MTKRKRGIIIITAVVLFSSFAVLKENRNSKNDFYKDEMEKLHTAIENNFHDSVSGYYFVDLDPAKRETKFGHKREYSWLWALCAMFEATNEMEKIDKKAALVDNILKSMQPYYDPAPPKPGYGEYIVKLSQGQRYYDDNQ